MTTVRKQKSTSPAFSSEQIAAAVAAATPKSDADRIDWKRGTVTYGGGVAETLSELKRTRGKNKAPTKQQIAIRIDQEVIVAFRAEGPGWQTRINEVLRHWVRRHRSKKPAATS